MISQPFDKLRLVTVATISLACLLAIPVIAEEETEYKSLRTVIKATMHIDVSEVQGVLDLLDVKFAVKPDQNLIIVRGANGAVENAMKVIDALDSPRPNIDLQVFVLAASKNANIGIPKELETAVNHLRAVFGYSGFELLDNLTLSVLEGRQGQVSGSLLLGDDSVRTGYHFGFQKVMVVPEEGQPLSIRIEGLKFDVSGQTADTLRASLMTDVQIHEGQKAVIGSSTPQGVGETLVLVVQAKASADPSAASK